MQFQVDRISGAAVVRACQNRITRCAVVGDSRSKFENALSSPVLKDFTCGRERMTARAVGHPQPAAERADDWRRPGLVSPPHVTKPRRSGKVGCPAIWCFGIANSRITRGSLTASLHSLFISARAQVSN